MLDRFTHHPHSVGETYGEHLVAASRFAFVLLGAGLACLVHGLLPFLFEQTASGAVQRLNARMIARRAAGPSRPQPLEPVAF
ncbi:MAG TPA: DUF6356 family protein [Caulobacteraceae bacterium]